MLDSGHSDWKLEYNNNNDNDIQCEHISSEPGVRGRIPARGGASPQTRLRYGPVTSISGIVPTVRVIASKQAPRKAVPPGCNRAKHLPASLGLSHHRISGC